MESWNQYRKHCQLFLPQLKTICFVNNFAFFTEASLDEASVKRAKYFHEINVFLKINFIFQHIGK